MLSITSEFRRAGKRVWGSYCECNDFACPISPINKQVCSGPTQGACPCKGDKCKCESGWTVTHTDSILTRTHKKLLIHILINSTIFRGRVVSALKMTTPATLLASKETRVRFMSNTSNISKILF